MGFVALFGRAVKYLLCVGTPKIHISDNIDATTTVRKKLFQGNVSKSVFAVDCAQAVCLCACLLTQRANNMLAIQLKNVHFLNELCLCSNWQRLQSTCLFFGNFEFLHCSTYFAKGFPCLPRRIRLVRLSQFIFDDYW